MVNMRSYLISTGAKTMMAHALLVALAVVAVLAGSAFANPTMMKLGPDYLAGFAFFKFAKATPDFDAWIKASSAYKNATPHDRVIMMRSEVPMIEGYFNAYVPNENPIKIKLQVKYSTPTAKKAEKMLAENGQIEIKMRLAEQKEDFFPIQIGNMWIAMIPGNLDEMMTLTFDREEYETFKRQASGGGFTGLSVDAVLQLALLPVSANIKEPMQVDDLSLWMLGVRIIDLELWDKKEERMAWYVEGTGKKASRNSDQIFNLYEP